ncbi:hypothetical protein COLO4_00464 [Corchorus olitorius]|uniref:Uncharacterized protein n=1 Tax=Corchorus olitorius TaxID=93759 RepID=A0A1R3L3Y7_9ROSI|nr:hypothetical protein COLO4_00464 [Corchorus olitorius]
MALSAAKDSVVKASGIRSKYPATAPSTSPSLSRAIAPKLPAFKELLKEPSKLILITPFGGAYQTAATIGLGMVEATC